MNTETNVAPAATEIKAEPAVPEVAEPTTTEAVEPASEKPAKTEEQKQLESVQRARTKAERNNARLFRENEDFKAQLADIQRRLPQQAQERVQVDPKDVERIITTRADELVRVKTLNDRCNAIANKGMTDFPDFDSALNVMRAELPLFGQNGPTPALEAILEMDNPSALIHHLGKNPDLASELAELSPIQLTRRLDKIEREMKSTKQPASTPKPLETVKTTSSPDAPDPEKDFKGWIAYRNKQEAANRRH